MNFKKLLLATTALFAASTSAAHAEPVTIALFGAAFAATTAGSLVSIGFGLAITYGLSLLQKASSSSSASQGGTQVDVQMGDDKPISFIAGKFATAGKRKYSGTWGDGGKTPNAFFVDVIEIGSIPNNAGSAGITSVWIDDQLCGVRWDEPHPDGRGYPVVEYRESDGKDHLWLKFLDGRQTSVDPYLTSKFGTNADRPWTGDMVGFGCQVVILTARYDTDLFSGIPQGLYEPHSVPLYDVRKDSSNGGSGTHRWTDPASWEPTQNPAVIMYNIIRGIYYNGEWVYGGQNLAAFRLPPSSWMAAANACDALVTLADGSQEPAYRAGYEFHGDEKPADAVEKLRAACNGRLAEVGGIFKLLVGAPGGAVYGFTDQDIIVTESQSLAPFPTLDDTVNAIEATYPEPAEKWASKDAPGRYSDVLEAEDGGRRLPASVSFEAAPFGNQVQRLMTAMVQEERRFRIHQFYLPPDAYALEPNDVVTWSSDQNGYTNKKFLVTNITGQRTFNQLVSLKEIDPSDYDWNSSMQLPTSIGWIGPITAPSQPLYGWTVEPAAINSSDGSPWRPSIKVSCAPDQDDVSNVWVQVRLAATGDIVFDSDATRYESPYSWIINASFKSNTNYQARGKFIPISSRSTDWSEWLPVTTPTVLIGADEIYLDGVVSELQNFVSDATVWIRDGTRQSLMDAQRLARLGQDQDMGNFTDRQQMRRELASVTAQITASYIETITVATGPNSAIVQRLEELSATIPNLATVAALNLLSAHVDTVEGEVQANADAITSLTAQVGDVSASANFRMSVYAAPSGYSSRIGMEARGGSAGAYRSASLFIDVPSSTSDPTRVSINADQFSITNGGSEGQPFIFQSGVLTLNAANIGTVTAGLINGGAGSKMVIDITNGVLTVSD